MDGQKALRLRSRALLRAKRTLDQGFSRDWRANTRRISQCSPSSSLTWEAARIASSLTRIPGQRPRQGFSMQRALDSQTDLNRARALATLPMQQCPQQK